MKRTSSTRKKSLFSGLERFPVAISLPELYDSTIAIAPPLFFKWHFYDFERRKSATNFTGSGGHASRKMRARALRNRYTLVQTENYPTSLDFFSPTCKARGLYADLRKPEIPDLNFIFYYLSRALRRTPFFYFEFCILR